MSCADVLGKNVVPYNAHKKAVCLLLPCHRLKPPRRMDQSPTQWRLHPAAQEASPTHPPPPSPPPLSPPSTRASSHNLNLMRCGLGTAGKVPSDSAGIWRCRFPRKPGMSASVRGCQKSALRQWSFLGQGPLS